MTFNQHLKSHKHRLKKHTEISRTSHRVDDIEQRMRQQTVVAIIPKVKQHAAIDNGTATHEAAHAVIGHILGIKPIEIVVRGDWGETSVEPNLESIIQTIKECARPSASFRKKTSKALEAFLKTTCAGYCADSKLAGYPPTLTSDNCSDRSVIAACLKYNKNLCPDRQLSLNVAQEEVLALLNMQGVWLKVQSIANTIKTTGGVLCEKQIEKLLPKCWKHTSRMEPFK